MIGILTFHKAINYGAVLQAYALRKAIESLGCSCEIINYAGEKMRRESKVLYFPQCVSLVDRVLHLYRLPMRAKTVAGFKRFLRDDLGITGNVLTDTDALREIVTAYDFFVAGSDQVFNYTGTGDDFNYYLEFEKDSAKKIAYAPSFGLSEVDVEHIERVRENLKGIKRLSVREATGADIVEKLTAIRPQVVCDPTFLITKEDWEEIAVAPIYTKPYVLVYSFGSRHLEGVAEKMAADMDGIVVNINRCLPSIFGSGRVKNAYAPGPREFLGLLKDAEVVVTNSFHGMALSVLLEKEFYAFTNHYEGSVATNSRFKNLGEKLGLSSRVFSSVETVERFPVDYVNISSEVKRWRQEGLAFLINSICRDNH